MIQVYFQLEEFTDDRGIVHRTQRRKSHSFVQGFLKSHFLFLNGSGTNVSITDVGGTGRSIGSNSNQFENTFLSTAPGRGGAGLTYGGRLSTHANQKGSTSTNNGIVVGTGTTSVTPTDYQLATLVADGSSSGQIEYFSSSGGTFAVAGSTGSFVLERLFRTGSGGPITINEVGVYACVGRVGRTDVNDLWHACIIRDIVSPGFAVADGAYMRVTYTISVTS